VGSISLSRRGAYIAYTVSFRDALDERLRELVATLLSKRVPGLIVRFDSPQVLSIDVPQKSRGDFSRAAQELPIEMVPTGSATCWPGTGEEVGVPTIWKRGKLIGNRYKLRRALGHGGAGEAWLATDVKLGKRVVLKRLRGGPPLSHAGAKRFSREIRYLARQAHPNIVQVQDCSLEMPVQWLAMEFAPNGSLENYLAGGHLTGLRLEAILIYLQDAALGLRHLHSARLQGRPIVHRDIKPSNILLFGRAAKISDLGEAYSLGGSSTTITRPDNLVGTLDYMSPQQKANPHTAQPADDVFMLGVTLWRSLGGETAPDKRTAIPDCLLSLPVANATDPQTVKALEKLYLAMVERQRAHRPSPAKVARALIYACRCHVAANLLPATRTSPVLSAPPR